MRVICLLSGGIDSPVAAHSIAKQGAEIVLLHMDNRPFSDEAGYEKVLVLRERLEAVLNMPLRLFVAPHGRNQEIFNRNCSRPYQCVLCKRTMLHVAKEVALRLGAEAVVTGESLGQVASQTLHNLMVESHDLHFPVLRPLIGLDKIEIENQAKKIGTYETSIGTPSICTIVPKHPITLCKLEDLLSEQSKVDLADMVRYSTEHLVEITDRRRACS